MGDVESPGSRMRAEVLVRAFVEDGAICMPDWKFDAELPPRRYMFEILGIRVRV